MLLLPSPGWSEDSLGPWQVVWPMSGKPRLRLFPDGDCESPRGNRGYEKSPIVAHALAERGQHPAARIGECRRENH